MIKVTILTNRGRGIDKVYDGDAWSVDEYGFLTVTKNSTPVALIKEWSTVTLEEPQ